MMTVKEYMDKAQQECIWATGYEMSDEDIQMHIECDEFVSMFGTKSFNEVIKEWKHAEPKRGEIAWCWWMSRYVIFTGEKRNGKYITEDFGDCIIEFTEQELRKLRFEK